MSTGNRTIHWALAALLPLTLMTAGGCSSLKGVFGEFPWPDDRAGQLEEARTLLQSGRDDQAKKMLKGILSGSRSPGITDEALFHLGLVTLKEESEGGSYPQSRQILGRLAREYPHSIWGVEAGTLNGLLVEFWQSEASHKRQLKSLKESNKELRLNIEKLKSLDLELEQKSRR